MQIIELERNDWTFFCPATGRPVFTDDGEPNTPALRGSWCHEVPEEPMHLDEELKPLWQQHLDAQAARDEDADVVGFLKSLDRPNWVAFEITTCGMGIESSTLTPIEEANSWGACRTGFTGPAVIA